MKTHRSIRPVPLDELIGAEVTSSDTLRIHFKKLHTNEETFRLEEREYVLESTADGYGWHGFELTEIVEPA